MTHTRKAITTAALALALALGVTTVSTVNAPPASASTCGMVVVYFIYPPGKTVYATYYYDVYAQAVRMGLRTSYNWQYLCR